MLPTTARRDNLQPTREDTVSMYIHKDSELRQGLSRKAAPAGCLQINGRPVLNGTGVSRGLSHQRVVERLPTLR